MKLIKSLLLAAVLSGGFAGCSKYDDTQLRTDVNELKSRVEKLEEWCNTTNGQISALQVLVSALENRDYVTGVTPVMEGTKEIGYTIAFAKSNPITIMHGKDGAQGEAGSPKIGVKKDTDGFYYWTIQSGDAEATWLTDDKGNKIRTTGDKGEQGATGTDGRSPELSVAEYEGRLYWKINGQWLLNNGQKVPATGDKGDTGATGGSAGSQGSCIFAKNGIDYTSDPGNVTFTLADGKTKITLPRSNGVTVGFDKYDTFYCSGTANEIALVLPATLKETDYTAIVATITNESGTGMDIQTRSATPGSMWGVQVTKPTFTNGVLVGNSAKVTITLPQDKTNYRALLKVTIIDAKGKEYSVSRIVWFKANQDANVIDNTSGTLATKITNPTQVKQLSVVGPVSTDDFQYIRENLTSMEVLDLSRATFTSLPEKAMAFYTPNGQPDASNTSLQTVILPETLTAIGNSAFAMCVNLREMNIPNSVRTLGRWMFEGCASLEEVKLPQGITELPASAFFGAGIRRVTIPSSVTTIGGWAFKQCNNLTSITIPASVTSLGESALEECANLQSADIQAHVTILKDNFFRNCKKLQEVKLSTSINTLANNSFGLTGLKEFTIPAHITMLKAGAFNDNPDLETVSIPAGVQMEWSVFNGCTKLKNVTIAEGVTEIGAETFRNCTALESIVLPSTITSIRDRAFQGCSALISLTCKATTMPGLSAHNSGENYNLHFFGINQSCVLKRPAGADYSTWSSKFGGGVEDLK